MDTISSQRQRPLGQELVIDKSAAPVHIASISAAPVHIIHCISAAQVHIVQCLSAAPFHIVQCTSAAPVALSKLLKREGRAW